MQQGETTATYVSDADRQKATASYLIERFGFRIGNERDCFRVSVGCCSLRCEHLRLSPPHSVHLSSLTANSVRYDATIDVEHVLHDNLQGFISKRKQRPEHDVAKIP